MGLLPSSKWRFLRHLSLADNGITHISTQALSPLAETLQSLDLSSNLFTEIPDSLATLTSLRALNLASCMISSLHSLARNPLPAINTLNLRGNRLASLAGIERLYSLERVDFRENRLADPTELARLTSIPDIREIHVNKNTFTSTHLNFRVTIFNLFRRTPGYSEDVMLDYSVPSYSERKQLVDRVPETAGVPIIKPPPEDLSVPSLPKVSFMEEPAQPPDPFIDTSSQRRHSSYAKKNDVSTGSQRKKRTPKRRVVELIKNEPYTAAEPDQQAPSTALFVRKPPTDDSTYGGSTDSTPTRPRMLSDHPPTTASAPVLLPAQTFTPVKPVTQEPQAGALERSESDGMTEAMSSINVNGDVYKKRIEALRSDFGNDWLSALGDSAWEQQAKRAYSVPNQETGTITAMRPPPVARTTSQSVVAGGRTLG